MTTMMGVNGGGNENENRKKIAERLLLSKGKKELSEPPPITSIYTHKKQRVGSMEWDKFYDYYTLILLCCKELFNSFPHIQLDFIQSCIAV